jgi:hypothetical protein
LVRTIEIQPEYADLIKDGSPEIRVEAPCIAHGVMEAVLAKLLHVASFSSGTYVISTPTPALWKETLKTWCRRLKLRVEGFYFVEPTETPPLRRCDVHVIEAADVAPFSVKDKLDAKQTILVGALPEEGHWFDGPKTHRFTAESLGLDIERHRGRFDESVFQRRVLLRRSTVGHVSFRSFAEQRLFVRPKTGPVRPFILRPIQCRYLAAKRRARMIARSKGLPGVQILVLKSRRFGISTIEQGLNYRAIVSNVDTHALTLAHNSDQTSKIFAIAKLMAERDPKRPFMPPAGNKRQISFPDMSSQFDISSALGEAPGRGSTLNFVHCSEVAQFCHNDYDKTDMLMAGLTEACSHGSLTCETTPNGENWFSEKWREAKWGENDWYPIFIPWFIDPQNRIVCNHEEILDTLSDEESGLIDRHQLVPEQIAWRRAAIRRNKKLFPQEYPEDDETCFLQTGTPFFDTESLLLMRKRVGSENKADIVVWKEPEDGHSYVAGMDVGEGLPHSDWTVCYVLDRETGEDVAKLRVRRRPEDAARMAAKLCSKYNALLSVERNNHGHSVLNTLRNQVHYKNLYQYMAYDAKLGQHVKRPGMPVSAITRPLLLDLLASWIETRPRVNDPEFVDEALHFKLQGSGKFEAELGFHDDHVFARAHAMYAAQSGQGRGTENIGVF